MPVDAVRSDVADFDVARLPERALSICHETKSCNMPWTTYFEGLDSERAIAWRASDSLSLAVVFASGATDIAARPLDDLAGAEAAEPRNASGHLQTHNLRRGLQQLADPGVLRGKTAEAAATTLEATRRCGVRVTKNEGRVDSLGAEGRWRPGSEDRRGGGHCGAGSRHGRHERRWSKR